MSMPTNLKSRIMEIYQGLNKMEKLVAQKVLENPKKIIHMPINETADYCGVSDTTVFRFCSKLGFKGFQDFKINLALGIVSPLENVHNEVTENDDTYMIMKKILGSSTHAMESAMEKNSAAKLDEASGFLLRANKICFFGMGGSYALAEDAYHKFIRTGILCDVSSDLHWQYMYSAMMKKDDVVVLFSNSGSNKDLIELTDYLWEREIKVITITQSDQTPLAKKSSVNLICSGEESAMRTEAMESRFSSLMLIDILFVICMKNRQDVTLRILNQIREGIANRRI